MAHCPSLLPPSTCPAGMLWHLQLLSTRFKKSTTFSLPSDSAMSRAAEPLSCDGTEVEGDMGEGREVVEETGPIQYSDDEDDEGAEVDDLIYDDDPLLHSDYEGKGG